MLLLVDIFGTVCFYHEGMHFALMLLCPFVVGQWLPQTWMRPVVDHMQYSVLFSHSEGNDK